MSVGLFLLISLLLLPAGGSATLAAPQPALSVRVEHRINVLDWGLLVVNDTITLTNTGTTPVSSFLVGVPERVGGHLDYVYARAGENETVSLELGADLGRPGFSAVKATFSPILSGATYRFGVAFVFSGLITFSAAGYNVTVPMYPSLSLEAEQVDVKVALPLTVTMTGSCWSVDGKPVLEYTQKPLAAYADMVSSKLSFTGSFKLVDCESARREVFLDPLREIRVSDSYLLKNVGRDSFNSVDFTLPGGAHNVTAQDEFGKLNVVSKEGRDAAANVTVTLRYPLRGDPHNDAGSFTLNYWLPWRLYASRLDAMATSQMHFTLLPDSKWVIRSLKSSVTLPEGAQYEEANPQPSGVERVGLNPVISYTVVNATPYHKLGFQLRYQYLIFWSAFRPTMWVGISLAVVCSLIGFQRLRKPGKPSEAVSMDALRSYVEVVDERTTLRLDMESLDEDLNRDRIRRHDYRRRVRQINQDVQSLDKELEGLKQKVRAIGPRYAEIVRRVEVAESEYDSARSSVIKLQTTYREGRVSKDAYVRLSEDLHKRMDRAKTVIEGITIGLREEIR